MLKQLKFAVSCRSSTMPVRSNRQTPELDPMDGNNHTQYGISTLPSFTSDF